MVQDNKLSRLDQTLVLSGTNLFQRINNVNKMIILDIMEVTISVQT